MESSWITNDYDISAMVAMAEGPTQLEISVKFDVS